jgi:hypothetical protein
MEARRAHASCTLKGIHLPSLWYLYVYPTIHYRKSGITGLHHLLGCHSIIHDSISICSAEHLEPHNGSLHQPGMLHDQQSQGNVFLMEGGMLP